MTRVDGSPKTFVISEQVVTEALVTPPQHEITAGAPHTPVAEVINLAAPEQQGNRRHVISKLAAGLVLGGTLFVGMAGRAEASPTTTTEAQSQSQDSSSNWIAIGALGVSTVTTVVGAITVRNNSKEKREDRFSKALGDMKGDSTGDERMARLNTIESFIHLKSYRGEINRTAATYLRGRRGSLEILRKTYAEDPDGYNHAVTERRNSDRSALKLFARTLDIARAEAEKQVARGRIRRFFGIKNEMEKLAELTGIYQEPEKPLVNARGLNLDEMRDVSGYDLHGLDLTGAGLQRNQISNVSFRESRLNEVQLDGTTIASSDLRGTDLRAAYFEGAAIEKCLISEDTHLGHLPDGHPKARHGSHQPDQLGEYRGDGRVVLKDLISDTLTKDQIIEKVKEWQRGGLTLLEGSNPEYFLNSTNENGPDQNQPK
ncbi:MAG TPA: pentapeptide repeat-containing protein [Candidatus Saccharimonadales bacterium]|nr:pentapeptide repeat-containing protein [Candidatus Saccharimonadales bacterium]